MQIDPALWKAYQIGIGVGIVILSTLLLFPGRTEDADAILREMATAARTTAAGAKPTTGSTAESDSSSRENSDSDPLTRQTRSRSHGRPKGTTNKGDYGYWTPHRRLNAAVYVILIATAALFLTRSYTKVDPNSDKASKPSSLLSVLFRTYFPNEAKVFWGPRSEEGQSES